MDKTLNKNTQIEEKHTINKERDLYISMLETKLKNYKQITYILFVAMIFIIAVSALSSLFTYKYSSNEIQKAGGVAHINREYRRLSLLNLKLEKDKLKLELELSQKNNYLNAIQSNYDIKIKEQDNKIWAESPQLDSAMLLLPVYRDKIVFDKNTQSWIVNKTSTIK